MIAINQQTERDEMIKHINRCNRYIAAVYQLLKNLEPKNFSEYEHLYNWLIDEAFSINQASDRWYEEEDERNND